MNKNILVLGSVNADHVVQVENFPRPGETISGISYNIVPGGKGANQALACQRLGGHTQFIACVGTDAFGYEIVEQFKDEGMDTSLMEHIEGEKTGVAFIYVNEQAENCISVVPEANKSLTHDKVQLYKKSISEADYLLLQLETPDAVSEAVKIANHCGTNVILNPAPASHLSDELLSCVDIITPNQTEAELLTGIKIDTRAAAEEAVDILHGKGIPNVIITMGKQGSLVSTIEEGRQCSTMVEGFKVDAVDTTAAGDTFNGAILVALAEGKSLNEAARFGNAAAALSVTRHGAQTSIPFREKVEQFLMS